MVHFIDRVLPQGGYDILQLILNILCFSVHLDLPLYTNLDADKLKLNIH